MSVQDGYVRVPKGADFCVRETDFRIRQFLTILLREAADLDMNDFQVIAFPLNSFKFFFLYFILISSWNDRNFSG